VGEALPSDANQVKYVDRSLRAIDRQKKPMKRKKFFLTKKKNCGSGRRRRQSVVLLVLGKKIGKQEPQKGLSTLPALIRAQLIALPHL